jgi:pimeloyl-ACP methyl ester carboxylesterase
MAISFELKLEPDRVVRGSFFPSRSEAHGTLIICHGFKGFKDWGFFPYAAEQLSEIMDVITFNFSHNGVGENLLEFTELEKFARNTYSRELEDLDAVVRAVESGSLREGVSVSTGPVFLLGHSKGAGTSLIYALDNPGRVAGIISWNGIADVNIFSKENIEEMKTRGRSYTLNGRTKQQMPLDAVILEDMEQNKERYDIIGRIKDIQAPVILIQGSEDSERLRKGSAALLNQNPAIQYVSIEGGNHTFNAVHPFQGETAQLAEALRHTKQFLESCLV